MTQSGGKMNKSLKAWVAFVKKVQKEEKLSYKDAIHRAKVRKDKGEKWMKGGADTETTSSPVMDVMEEEEVMVTPESETVVEEEFTGGKRKRRTVRRSRGKGRGRTARRGRSRSARRH
jgi:hypothetical protein